MQRLRTSSIPLIDVIVSDMNMDGVLSDPLNLFRSTLIQAAIINAQYVFVFTPDVYDVVQNKKAEHFPTTLNDDARKNKTSWHYYHARLAAAHLQEYTGALRSSLPRPGGQCKKVDT